MKTETKKFKRWMSDLSVVVFCANVQGEQREMLNTEIEVETRSNSLNPKKRGAMPNKMVKNKKVNA